VKYKPNRTENRFKSNRSGFLGKKPGNLNPNPDPPTQNSTWSFGSLIRILATKSESVIEIYKKDLEEFGSGFRHNPRCRLTRHLWSPRFLRGQRCYCSGVYQGVMGSFGETWLDFYLCSYEHEQQPLGFFELEAQFKCLRSLKPRKHLNQTSLYTYLIHPLSSWTKQRRPGLCLLNADRSEETGKGRLRINWEEDWEFIWEGGGFLWDEMHREEGLTD